MQWLRDERLASLAFFVVVLFSEKVIRLLG